MSLNKPSKKIYWFVVLGFLVIGLVLTWRGRSPAQENWKTWTWDNKCGGFEIHYPPEWNVEKIRSSRLGCVGEVFVLPQGQSSLAQADQGAVLRFNYSETSAEAQTTGENIQKQLDQFPEKAFSASVLRCIREENLINTKNHVSIQCYTTREKGIYVANIEIKGDTNRKFEDQIRQILSSFTFTLNPIMG